MKFIFLGAPGAGKGTLAEIVSDRYGIPVISTGAMIRTAIKEGTPFGKKAALIIENGNLIDDETVTELVRERLAKDDCKNGFILDGFPRTIPQANALEDIVKLDYAVYLRADDEAIIARLAGRRYCKKCGATYHVTRLPSKDGVNCDKCGEMLAIRADDAPETVRNRLDVYHEQSAPLIDYYKGKGKFIEVNGDTTSQETAAEFFEIIGKLQ